MENSKLTTGVSAPDFVLADKDGNTNRLADFRGMWIVLYFYPKDNTSGCTLEAKEFSEAVKEFSNLNAEIIGVSPDSASSHAKFIEKQGLEILLLSDPNHKVLEDYDVWQLKKMYGREYFGVVRSTFLIDPQGKIAHIWMKVKVKGHVEEVRAKLEELQGKNGSEK